MGGFDRGGWSESMLQAIDYKTGKVRWTHKWEGNAGRSGIVTTAGNVLFTGGPSNDLVALNAATGDALWHSTVGGSISNGPITYELDGRQYVVAAAGDTLWTFVLDTGPGMTRRTSTPIPNSQLPRDTARASWVETQHRASCCDFYSDAAKGSVWELGVGSWELGVDLGRDQAMQFAICNEQFEGWTFGRVCQFVKSVGYEGLEMAPFTLAPRITDVDKARRAELRRQADGAGVSIIGLHWLLAKTEGLYLTSPDEAVRARTAQYLVDLAEATQDFGGDLMVFGSPEQRRCSRVRRGSGVRLRDRHLPPRHAGSRRRTCSCAWNRSHPPETDFINTAAEGARLMDAVGHPNFVLHLDVKAMSSEPTPVPDIIRRYANRTGHFHANDPNRRGPGFGDVDFVPIFQALKESGTTAGSRSRSSTTRQTRKPSPRRASSTCAARPPEFPRDPSCLFAPL